MHQNIDFNVNECVIIILSLVYKMASKWKLYIMISFLTVVIIAISVISIYFVFVKPPEDSESEKVKGNVDQIELFEFFENNF